VLYCSECPISSIPSFPNLSELYCPNCPVLTNISLPNLNILYCYRCPLLISISAPMLTTLDCSNSSILTSISEIDRSRISIGSHYNTSGCKWLYNDDERIEKLTLIQRRIRQVVKYYRFVRFIKSREFNEWFYAPEGIGGKMNKVILEKFVSTLKNKLH